MTTASRSLATALRMGALRERLAPPSYTTSWDTTANGPLHPPQTAENRGCNPKTGNSGLAQDCVVGLRGLEPATRRLSAPAGKFRMRRPTSVEGIEKYLASGMIRGIGPVYVQKLLRAFVIYLFYYYKTEK